MKKRKKLIMAVSAGLVILASLLLFVAPALAAVNVGSRNTTHFFDYNGGSGWNDLKTPEHYITGTSPEQIAYCLQHKNDSPSNSPYNESDILGSYSARVHTGLRIILENGYPYSSGGLTAAEARYATANAVRFWLSENGDSSQYNFTNLGTYSDAQLRTAAAAGQIGNKIRANSGYTDVLQFSIELLIKARSQALMIHDISLSATSMSVNGGYFVGTSTVTLTNMNGGYTLDTSGLPSGSSVTGFTGKSGDVLTIRIPLNEANANRSFSLSATGRDNRTRSNMFAYAPNNSGLQRIIVAKPAVYNDAKNVVRSFSTPQIYADLIVSALSSNASTYDAGDTITITATIQNQGLRSAGGFSVALTSADLPTQTKSVSSLAAGASTTVTYTYTAPQFSANKSVTVTATADSTGVIAESNENNNTRSTTFTVRSLPDLIVSALTSDKAQYLPGDTITITATVQNQGATAAGGFYVSLASPDLATQTKYVSSLAAGASTTITFTYTASQYTASKTITVTATADSTGIIAETNENNNTQSATFTVLVLPDLTVSALTCDKPAYEAGETVTVSATVKNDGTTPTAATTVRLTVPGIGVYSKSVSALNAGASQTVPFTFTAPTALTPQSITVTAYVDPDNLIQESNENNNTRTAVVQINALRPDIEITDSTVTDWYAGLKVTVSATVRNRTAQPVPAVAIRLTVGGASYTESIPVPGNGSNLAVFKITVPVTASYTVRIVADPDGALNEVNENNNVLTKDIQVKPVPPSLVADPDDADMEQRHVLYGLMGTPPSVPSVYHTWQEVRLESGSYVVKNYWARLTTVFTISPDTRIAYEDRPRVMESGFGYSVTCSTVITTNYDRPEKLTGAQMVWMRSPESAYGQLARWQDVRDSLAVKTGIPGDAAVTWQLKANPWSAIGSLLHFVPLWFPDGEYLAWVQAFYGWSPAGQLFDFKTDSLVIDGDMYDRVTTVRWRW
jgi:subtilase family serine protease